MQGTFFVFCMKNFGVCVCPTSFFLHEAILIDKLRKKFFSYRFSLFSVLPSPLSFFARSSLGTGSVQITLGVALLPEAPISTVELVVVAGEAFLSLQSDMSMARVFQEGLVFTTEGTDGETRVAI